MNPTNCLRATLVHVVIAVVALTAPGATAQDDPGDHRLTINFDGGTLDEYITLLRERFESWQEITNKDPMPLNVILRDDAPTMPVPPISLRGVSVETAISVAIPESGVATETLPDGRVVEVSRSLQTIREGTGSAPVFVIEVRRTDVLGQAPPRPTHQRIEVYSLEEAAVAGPGAGAVISVESMLTAIDAALQLDDPSSPDAEIKYHAESGLLIVRATDRQHDAIDSVLHNLNRNALSRMREKQKITGEIRQISDEIAVRRAEARTIETRIELAHESAGQLAALVESGVANSRELLAAEAEQKILQTELETAVVLLQSLHDRLEEAEAHLQRSQGETSLVSYDLKAFGTAAEPVADLLRAIRAIAAHGPFDLTITDAEARITASEGVHEQFERAISDIGKIRSSNRPRGGRRPGQ